MELSESALGGKSLIGASLMTVSFICSFEEATDSQ